MAASRPGDRPGNSDDEQGGTPSPGVIGGAALVGAGVGVLISGPLVALGLGAAAAALTLRSDKAGEVARSTGRAGVAIVDKSKEINERYGVTEKVKDAAHNSYEKAKVVNEEHGVVDKAKVGASRAWQRIRELDREHNLTTRAGEAFEGAMDEVAKAASTKDDSDSAGSTK